MPVISRKACNRDIAKSIKDGLLEVGPKMRRRYIRALIAVIVNSRNPGFLDSTVLAYDQIMALAKGKTNPDNKEFEKILQVANTLNLNFHGLNTEVLSCLQCLFYEVNEAAEETLEIFLSRNLELKSLDSILWLERLRRSFSGKEDCFNKIVSKTESFVLFAQNPIETGRLVDLIADYCLERKCGIRDAVADKNLFAFDCGEIGIIDGYDYHKELGAVMISIEAQIKKPGH